MPAKNFSNYLFLGEEDFLKEEEINRLKSQFLDKSSEHLNYAVFYAQDKDFDTKGISETLYSWPFLSKRRLVLLKHAEELSPKDKESIINYLKKFFESVNLALRRP